MSNPSSSTSAVSLSSVGKKPKKTRNDISQDRLDLIAAAISVAESAQHPDYLPTLSDPEKGALDPAVAARILSNAALAEEQKAPAIETALAAQREITETEAFAKKSLMAAIRKIQAGARRKFAASPSKLHAYFIGDESFGGDRAQLEVQAQAILDTAAGDDLPGIQPALLTDADGLLAAWIAADDLQRKAERTVATAYAAFDVLVRSMENDMIEIRLAVESCWPYTTKTNATIRRAFGMPEHRPYNVVPHGTPVVPVVSSSLSSKSSSSFAPIRSSSSLGRSSSLSSFSSSSFSSLSSASDSSMWFASSASSSSDGSDSSDSSYSSSWWSSSSSSSASSDSSMGSERSGSSSSSASA